MNKSTLIPVDSYFIESHEISLMLNNGRSEEGIISNYCMGRITDYYKFYEHNIIIKAITNAIGDVELSTYVKFSHESVIKELRKIDIDHRKTSYEEIEKLITVLGEQKIYERLSDALATTPCIESILLEAKEYEKKKMEENRELLRSQGRAKQLSSKKHK